jgi:hypothetical protein
MPDVKISALPSATAVGTADIFVLNQGGITKTASKSLVIAGLATTDQIGGLNSAQVQALTSDQIAAITPATIGALSTDAASGFATTQQIVGIAFTSQLSGFATTEQISGFTNTAQVSAIASAQVAAITPASIGAFATSAIIGIGNGGTGATDAPSALAALGGITSAQVPALDTAQLSAYVLKAGSTMDGRLIMAATTAQAKANIGGFIGAASPSTIVAGDVWVSNQSKLTFSPSTGVNVGVAGLNQANTFNQTQTIGVGGAVNALTVSNNGTGRAATFTAASTSAAVSILQTGAGEAFRVEDDTSPDATAFVISASGRVGIGATPDAVTALAVDSGGIKFGDGSIQTSAAGAFSSAQLSGYATTTDIQGIAFTSQLSAFTNSAQVQSLASAQISAITPGSIGAVATSDVIAITNGGTGSTSAAAALTALGAMSATQAAGGDLSGNLPSPTVAKIQGNAVSETAPSNGQVLQWNGTAWVPGEIPSGGSGGGGQVFFFNYNTAADAPTTGLPTTPTIVKELGRTADTTGTSYTSGDLSTTGYDLVVHFITDVLDPNITAIPAGLFDFNFWASSTGTTSNETIVQLKVFKYDGTTATLLSTSDDISIYDPAVTAQYIASVVIPQTTVSTSDRLYIQFLGKATQNNKTITFNFGATQPSHVHTTVPSVGGSGLVKVVDGVFQSPASLLVNADVATNAAIALSKVAMSQVSVLSGDGLTGGGDLSTSRTLALTTTGVSALSYGSSTQIAAFTVDAYGRLTAASNQAISATGIGAQIALTSAAPLAIDKGGTGAISTQAAISSLGIGMRMVEAQTTANIVGTMNTGVSPNTFTVTATGVFATDGYTPVLGDIIAFALQTTTTQNGFWEVTTVGAVGVQAVFTRPSWYTGVVRNSMYMSRFGSSQNGFVQTFVGPTGTGTTEITVGTTNITMVRVNLRASPASLSSNVFTGPQTLRANGSGAQNCPLIFQSGVALMGTPIGNAVEWFGDQMYLTTAAGVRTTNTTHVAIPATSTSAGLVGQVAVDNANNWLYVCTATNVWKRVLLATF